MENENTEQNQDNAQTLESDSVRRLVMQQKFKKHTYEYIDGGIIDLFGGKMDSVDEYAEEFEMLRDYIIKLQEMIECEGMKIPSI
tara:strand:- start:903 stop:1157 length:255 start_codon:yes stop_codon:yes gene_type:complete